MTNRVAQPTPLNHDRARRADAAGYGYPLDFPPLSQPQHGRSCLFRRHFHQRGDNLDLLIWIGS